jgi:predicted transcriptional regulator
MRSKAAHRQDSSMTKIKLLCAVADDRSSNMQGDIIDKPADVAAAWVKEGIAIEAPEAEVAADRIAEFSKALDDITAERDGLAKQVTDLQGKLAAALKEKQGAQAEADVHRKAAEDAAKALAKSAKGAPNPPKV